MLHIDAEQLQALQQASGGDGDGGQLLLVDQSVGVVKQEAEEPLEEERKDIVEDIKHQIRELVCIPKPYRKVTRAGMINQNIG